MRLRGVGWWLLAAVVVGGIIWRWATGQQVFASWSDQRRFIGPLIVVMLLVAPLVAVDVAHRIPTGFWLTREGYAREIIRIRQQFSKRR